MGARSVAKKEARATSKFAKPVANLAKKVGPVLASVLNLIAKVLTWGAKDVAFLAKKLWILALALTYLLYNEYRINGRVSEFGGRCRRWPRLVGGSSLVRQMTAMANIRQNTGKHLWQTGKWQNWQTAKKCNNKANYSSNRSLS
jgi:hypothetical protein